MTVDLPPYNVPKGTQEANLQGSAVGRRHNGGWHLLYVVDHDGLHILHGYTGAAAISNHTRIKRLSAEPPTGLFGHQEDTMQVLAMCFLAAQQT